MTPIEYRVDGALMQALSCVEYRIPSNQLLKENGFLAALALRYGLMGAVATHQLLIESSDTEKDMIRIAARDWERLVLSHARLQALRTRAHQRFPTDTQRIAELAGVALNEYLSAYARSWPMQRCLEEASRSFCEIVQADIRRGWPWFKMLKAKATFTTTTVESIRFAMLFFERRKLNLDEVAEIALIGE